MRQSVGFAAIAAFEPRGHSRVSGGDVLAHDPECARSRAVGRSGRSSPPASRPDSHDEQRARSRSTGARDRPARAGGPNISTAMPRSRVAIGDERHQPVRGEQSGELLAVVLAEGDLHAELLAVADEARTCGSSRTSARRRSKPVDRHPVGRDVPVPHVRHRAERLDPLRAPRATCSTSIRVRRCTLEAAGRGCEGVSPYVRRREASRIAASTQRGADVEAEDRSGSRNRRANAGSAPCESPQRARNRRSPPARAASWKRARALGTRYAV
jgi:hypothetical protein